jgi:hypothetical protein
MGVAEMELGSHDHLRGMSVSGTFGLLPLLPGQTSIQRSSAITGYVV